MGCLTVCKPVARGMTMKEREYKDEEQGGFCISRRDFPPEF